MFVILVSEKGGEEKRLEFDKGEVTIGRIQGNDIVLPKGNVSKRHSRLVFKDGKFIVVDLKSTNGTFVNGRKITSPIVVRSSDKIYIGDFVLAIEDEVGAQDSMEDSIPPPPIPAITSDPFADEPDAAEEDMPSVAAAGGEREDEDVGAEDVPFEIAPPEDVHDRPTIRPPSSPVNMAATPMMPSPTALPRATGGTGREQAPRAPIGQIPVSRPNSETVPIPAESPASARTMIPTGSQRVQPKLPVTTRPAPGAFGIERNSPSALSRPAAETPETLTARRVLREVWRDLLHKSSFPEKGSVEVGALISDAAMRLNLSDEPASAWQESLVREIWGFGPLELLLGDDSVNQIELVRFDKLYVERNGKWHEESQAFSCAESVRHVVRRLQSQLGYGSSGTGAGVGQMWLDGGWLFSARLDSSGQGPSFELQRGGVAASSLRDWVAGGVLSQAMLELVERAVDLRKNILVLFPPLINAVDVVSPLVSGGHEHERVAMVGRILPLLLSGQRVFDYPNSGVEFSIDQPIRSNPHRLVVSDLANEQAFALLGVILRGAQGLCWAFSSAAEKSSFDAFRTYVQLGSGGATQATDDAIRHGIGLVIQVGVAEMGRFRITELAEIDRSETGEAHLLPLFHWRADGAGGRFVATGRQPSWG